MLRTTERQPSGLVAQSADAALTAGVRSLRVAFDAAATARALFSGELEALSAFGTRRYTAQAMQVVVISGRSLGQDGSHVRGYHAFTVCICWWRHDPRALSPAQ
jgi:hypothetical protein